MVDTSGVETFQAKTRSILQSREKERELEREAIEGEKDNLREGFKQVIGSKIMSLKEDLQDYDGENVESRVAWGGILEYLFEPMNYGETWGNILKLNSAVGSLDEDQRQTEMPILKFDVHFDGCMWRKKSPNSGSISWIPFDGFDTVVDVSVSAYVENSYREKFLKVWNAVKAIDEELDYDEKLSQEQP